MRVAAIDPDKKLPDVFIHKEIVYVFCNISLEVSILPEKLGPLFHKIFIVLLGQINEYIRIVNFPGMFTAHFGIHVFLPLTEPLIAEDIPDGALSHPLLPHFMSKQCIL